MSTFSYKYAHKYIFQNMYFEHQGGIIECDAISQFSNFLFLNLTPAYVLLPMFMLQSCNYYMGRQKKNPLFSTLASMILSHNFYSYYYFWFFSRVCFSRMLQSCNYRVGRKKEGCSRVVTWRLFSRNAYTIEASFKGPDYGPLQVCVCVCKW